MSTTKWSRFILTWFPGTNLSDFLLCLNKHILWCEWLLWIESDLRREATASQWERSTDEYQTILRLFSLSTSWNCIRNANAFPGWFGTICLTVSGDIKYKYGNFIKHIFSTNTKQKSNQPFVVQQRERRSRNIQAKFLISSVGTKTFV